MISDKCPSKSVATAFWEGLLKVSKFQRGIRQALISNPFSEPVLHPSTGSQDLGL